MSVIGIILLIGVISKAVIRLGGLGSWAINTLARGQPVLACLSHPRDRMPCCDGRLLRVNHDEVPMNLDPLNGFA